MEKEKIFDNIQDNFKKICTENGIDTDAFTKFIISTIELIPEEEKLSFLESLITDEVLMGTDTIYEALGVLELVKATYLTIMKNDDDDD
jgi:hypothetical protein